MCPPSHRDDLTLSGCNITLLSRADTEVTIDTATWSQKISLKENVPFTITLDPGFHVDEGVEEKGIIISSNEELIVTIVKLDRETQENQFVDAYQVYDRRLAGNEYFILHNEINACPGRDYVKSFFSVLSFEDTTFVEIYDRDGYFLRGSIINYFQVYTQRTIYMDDFSGMRVKLSGRSLVVTGSLCSGNSINNITASYITSLPPGFLYGDEYPIPGIGGSNVTSYEVRILGTSAQTDVYLEGDTFILSRNEYIQFKYLVDDLAPVVRCSNPCLVVQWSVGSDIGNFLFNVLALTQSTRFASFTTLNFEGEHWVSIVVLGYPPMDDIYLDDQNLNDATWRVRLFFARV